MMIEQCHNIIELVYARFMDNEGSNWTDVDDNLEYFSWLSNRELINESLVKHIWHSKGVFRCNQNHEQIHCFAPYILEAVGLILNFYGDNTDLDPKHKYILEYYLSFSELGLIYVLSDAY